MIHENMVLFRFVVKSVAMLAEKKYFKKFPSHHNAAATNGKASAAITANAEAPSILLEQQVEETAIGNQR